MPSIRRRSSSERHERLAVAYERSVGAYASELSNTRDPILRERFARKIEQARSNAARFRKLAIEARERGE